MARTFPLCDMSKSRLDGLVKASIQSYADELCNMPVIYNNDVYTPQELVHLLLTWKDKLSPLEKHRVNERLCIHCGQPGHAHVFRNIRRRCPSFHPENIPAKTSPSNGAPEEYGSSIPSSIPEVPVQVPFDSQTGEDLLRRFDELQTNQDWPISTAKYR
jgi:hypothetical protein